MRQCFVSTQHGRGFCSLDLLEWRRGGGKAEGESAWPMDLVEAVRDQLETHTEATLDAPLSFEAACDRVIGGLERRRVMTPVSSFVYFLSSL